MCFSGTSVSARVQGPSQIRKSQVPPHPSPERPVPESPIDFPDRSWVGGDPIAALRNPSIGSSEQSARMGFPPHPKSRREFTVGSRGSVAESYENFDLVLWERGG